MLTSANAWLSGLEHRAYRGLRARADRKLQPAKAPHLLVGERGEDAAFFHLRNLGYTVVARRWRTHRLRGDLDLVAWDGDKLVIFEIKTRSARDLTPAELAVDRDKRNQLRDQAAAYLRHLPASHRASIPVRFDILAVYLLATGTEFEHFRAAFPFQAPREDRPFR
jgi:putative endonuclease